jgi:hypothetical protein
LTLPLNESILICHPISCVLLPLHQVFLAAESVEAAHREVFDLASEAVEPSPGTAVLAAEISPGTAVSEAVALSPGIVALAPESDEAPVSAVEPEVFSAAAAFVAAVFPADTAEPRASADILAVFVVLAPVSDAVVEVDSPERPTFVAFPNVDCYATSASSAEVFGDQSVRNTTDAHTNYGFCSILSTLGLHHNKNLEHSCNNPSPDYNTVSDTNDHSMGATTNHSRKINLCLFQEQHKHRAHQAEQSQPEVRRMG